jgi:hypothetical protein
MSKSTKDNHVETSAVVARTERVLDLKQEGLLIIAYAGN